MKVKYSKTGSGQHRTTYHNNDGTKRIVTDRKSGGTTVTDIDQLGRRTSGRGVSGNTGSHNGTVRQTTYRKR